MRISDLMTTNVITIGPDASLKEAARRMLEAGVSGLPVTDHDAVLVGIITEADFVRNEADRGTRKRAGLLRWLTHDAGFSSHERKVGDVMSSPVLTAEPDDTHTEAAKSMAKNNIKRLPVLENGRMVGVVSRVDVLRSFVRPDKAIIDQISDDLMRRVLWVDADRVNIRCVDGNVVLTGRLETKSDADLLVSLTERLDGVASVQSELTWELDNTKLDTTSRVSVPFLDRGR